MVLAATRGAPAAPSQGELGGEANRASAIQPPRVRGLVTSGPLDMLSSSRWYSSKVTELSPCGAAHLRGARRQTRAGGTRGIRGECILETVFILGAQEDERHSSARGRRARRGGGQNSPAHPEGVAVPADQSLRGCKLQTLLGSAATCRAARAAPSTPRYVKPAFAMLTPASCLEAAT